MYLCCVYAMHCCSKLLWFVALPLYLVFIHMPLNKEAPGHGAPHFLKTRERALFVLGVCPF